MELVDDEKDMRQAVECIPELEDREERSLYWPAIGGLVTGITVIIHIMVGHRFRKWQDPSE